MNNFFTTKNGLEIPIIPGFREQIKSNWRKAYKKFEQPVTPNLPLETVNKLKKDVYAAESLLNLHGYSIKGKKVMDVGCYLGIQCFGALELGASEAVGIDIPEYYINQSTENVKEKDASLILTERRNGVRKHFPGIDHSKISFKDESVFEMDYENEFDIIFSWETFEHILDPKEALKRIYKALKPGGISFNIYNPFFCISGGHSMCTLDYPFAHIMLSNEDFKKYIHTVIPENKPPEYENLSYEFFTKNLNRMTQSDLRQYINESGFKLIEYIAYPEWNLLYNSRISPLTLPTAKSLYPNITLNDLLCANVHFIVQK